MAGENSEKFDGKGVQINDLEVSTGAVTASRKSMSVEVANEQLVIETQKVPEKEKVEMTLMELDMLNDELVAKLESQFDEFEKKVTDKQAFISKNAMKRLLMVFQYTHVNKNNRDKNANRLFRTNEKVTLEKVDFFMYFLDTKLERGDWASFNPKQRTMYLRPNFNVSSFLDLSFFVHELVHAAQDNAMRNFLSSEDYERFYQENPGEGKNHMAAYESQAWALQIEMINGLVEDRLRKNAVSGQSLSDYEIVSSLGGKISEESLNLARQIIKFAKVYYKKGLDDNGHPDKEFTDLVMSIYKSEKDHFYTLDASGKLVPYEF